MSGRTGAVSGTADPSGPAVSVEPSSGVGPASAWPLRSYLELGALPSAVPSARLHARLVVGEWGLGDLAETAELVVSELVTNAVVASEGLIGCRYRGRWRPGKPPVRLWVLSDRDRVLVQVWDGNDRMPRRQEPELHAEHGRGLLLVETLCTEWGTYKLAQSSGKVVWAVCTTA